MSFNIISNYFNNSPVSSFDVKAKPSVNGVGIPSGAFFQEEHLSIPLQRSTILKTLCSESTGAALQGPR